MTQVSNDSALTGLPIEALCMGCTDEKCDFKPMPMQRRPVGEEDVLIDMVRPQAYVYVYACECM